jgi:ubiquitin-conjugating enzyme E2 D/E
MLWDAVFAAGQQLLTFAQANPPQPGEPAPVLRVFALTDGEDNKSELRPWQVAQFLQKNNILLDAIPVAGPNNGLAALSKASGGLCFDVSSNEQANGLFEREATLHVAYREPAEPAPRIDSPEDFAGLQAAMPKKAAVVDIQSVVPVAVFSPCLKPADVVQRISKNPGGGAVSKRVLKEYNDFMKDPPAGFSIYVSADDSLAWKAILMGPPGPYEGGHWILTINFPADYPFKPPKVRFVTPIYHCNISRDGALCLDILKDNWSPALTVPKVLVSISSLLVDPNPDDPLDTWKGELCRVDRKAYDAEIVKFTAAHAMASFGELVAKYNLA